MSRATRIVPALLALLASAVLVAACGGVPGNSVAQVGDTNITKNRFQKWLEITAKSGQQAPGQTVVVPDPPDFAKCIASKRKQSAQAPKGQPKPDDKALKSQCRREYSELRKQTLTRLIQGEWVEGEAADQGVKVSDQDVRKRFDQQKKETFPREKDFTTFLKQSGMSLDDILYQVKLDLLATKLREKVTKGKGKVTDEQVTAYYEKNKRQFATPERRNVRLVLTRTEAKAKQALKALKGGTSFKAAVKKYSTDAQTKGNGGLLEGVIKGQGGDVGLDKVAFSAPKGKLRGPVKGQFGWYVFRVEKVAKEDQQPLAEVRASIRKQLIQQNQQKALSKFVKKFEKKWTAKTECRKNYKVQGCKGYKKPKTPPGGGQQQAPQQVPQQGQQAPQDQQVPAQP